jgi:hypothetical protein
VSKIEQAIEQDGLPKKIVEGLEVNGELECQIVKLWRKKRKKRKRGEEHIDARECEEKSQKGTTVSGAMRGSGAKPT